MYSKTSQGENINYNVVEFCAEFRSDIDTLPTKCGPGSSCLVLEDVSIWIFGPDLIWHELD